MGLPPDSRAIFDLFFCIPFLITFSILAECFISPYLSICIRLSIYGKEEYKNNRLRGKLSGNYAEQFQMIKLFFSEKNSGMGDIPEKRNSQGLYLA